MIGFIGDVWNIVGKDIIQNGLFGGVKHWADIKTIALKFHTTCTIKPRATEKVKKDCFCLIAHIMGNGNFIHNIFLEKCFKHAKARFTRGFFKGHFLLLGKAGNINAELIGANAIVFAPIHNKLCIIGAFFAQGVVNMNSANFNIKFALVAVKIMQKCHTVAAATCGNANNHTCLDKFLRFDLIKNIFHSFFL